jgi:hypothetical protein
MVEKIAAFRRRRAVDTARWRDRLRRGAAVFSVEIDAATLDLMERYARLRQSQMDNRKAVSLALGRLLRLAFATLLEQSRCQGNSIGSYVAVQASKVDCLSRLNW